MIINMTSGGSSAYDLIKVSVDDVELSADIPSADVTIYHTGKGELTVSSDDPAVATVDLVSGDVYKITGVGTGATTIIVTTEDDRAVIGVSCRFTQIYGAEWDGSSSTTWTRTDASADFVDPVPAVSNGDGSSPFDDCMPWSGMKRVEDSAAGTLVEIPKFWYKWTRNGSSMKLQIADGPADGFSVSPAHMDKGDGKGERDTVYVGAYHCAASTYKSTTGVKPEGNHTRSEFRTSIHNLGSNIWQFDYAMLWTIRMLYLVEFAHWNSQEKIGYGCGNNSSTENMGSTDSMTYHTGTNAANRTTYGHVRYRWIEDLWGNVYDWCDGIYFGGTSNATIYGILNPANFSDTSGGTAIGTRPTDSGDITGWTQPSATGLEWALYAASASGTDYSIYVCDRCPYNSSGVVLYVGGYCYQNQAFGLFCMSGNNAASGKNAYIGSRLQKLP